MSPSRASSSSRSPCCRVREERTDELGRGRHECLRHVNYASSPPRLNVLIALLAVALVGAAYWYFWRPLPLTSGSMTAPVSGEITIARDRLDVPHIRASNLNDALFAQGYVTASERMWQMDSLRRLAAGDWPRSSGRWVSRPTVNPAASECAVWRRILTQRCCPPTVRRSRPIRAASTTTSIPIAAITRSSSPCWVTIPCRGAPSTHCSSVSRCIAP